ncbi:hypothetical protein CsSME_00004315 [Camellia sinensis var. sinensis]
MERKQGFFSALKDEVSRGLSPGRSRGRSPSRSVSPGSGLLRRRRPAAGHHVAGPDVFISRSESLRPAEALSPLMEGPDPDESDGGDSRMERWGHWMKGQLGLCLSTVRSEVAAQCFGSTLQLAEDKNFKMLLSMLMQWVSNWLVLVSFLSVKGTCSCPPDHEVAGGGLTWATRSLSGSLTLGSSVRSPTTADWVRRYGYSCRIDSALSGSYTSLIGIRCSPLIMRHW